jgi:hypothetical protein
MPAKYGARYALSESSSTTEFLGSTEICDWTFATVLPWHSVYRVLREELLAKLRAAEQVIEAAVLQAQIREVLLS